MIAIRPAISAIAAVLVLGAASVSSAQQAGSDPRITIAILGDDQVANSKPWMRSTMTASFEEALVNAKRFRVVSQSIISDAVAQVSAGNSNPIFDPSLALKIGKAVQAKYVVVVKQLRAEPKQKGPIIFKRWNLDLGLQAQVINIETTDIAQSTTYSREFPIAGWLQDDNGLQEDKLGTEYAKVVSEIADDFVTNTAVTLMPLETIILDVTPTEVILYGGADTGVAVGASFEVWREVGKLELPDGRTIVRTAKAARLTVARVEQEISYAVVSETFGEAGAKDPAPDVSRLTKGMAARLAAQTSGQDR